MNHRSTPLSPTASLPVRRHPSRHSVLERIGDSRPVMLFVTTVVHRRQPVLARPGVHNALLDAWNAARNWRVCRYVVMPDHVHLLCCPGTFPVPDFHRWMKYWKTLVARTFPGTHIHPLWQRQCWDTQIRSHDNFTEKWQYIRENPVRRGLVSRAADWPFQGELFPIPWLAN